MADEPYTLQDGIRDADRLVQTRQRAQREVLRDREPIFVDDGLGDEFEAELEQWEAGRG